MQLSHGGYYPCSYIACGVVCNEVGLPGDGLHRKRVKIAAHDDLDAEFAFVFAHHLRYMLLCWYTEGNKPHQTESILSCGSKQLCANKEDRGRHAIGKFGSGSCRKWWFLGNSF